jgi:hypothetical protein
MKKKKSAICELSQLIRCDVITDQLRRHHRSDETPSSISCSAVTSSTQDGRRGERRAGADRRQQAAAARARDAPAVPGRPADLHT